ncbi:RHS repeat-associated core domain-containing protein [Chitinophaga sp. CF118]|uniref:RHS repeat-associated core domain-containing protein n=1 Tax=Chitinophaga sp. CF118 TaxID=1884367 RepID=UPI0015A5301A|nr:RHS repeat-associated core domain-containing protein [Chitinophaga sp. CF118]
MKTLSLFIILFLSLIFQNSKAQVDVLQDSRVNPLLKQVALKRPGLRIFGRQKETDKYVNMAVLEENRKTITWFTCYGQAFDSAQLTNSEYNQIVLKSLDPFTLYKNISYENIFYVESAEGTYRLKGKVALQDTSYNNHVVFNAAPVVSAQSTLQKLMAMEGLLKKMCTQLRLFDSRSPSHLIGNDSFGIRKALAGKMVIKADSTVYYNIDPLAPVAKIMLSKHVPEKIFVYNRQEHLIDSVPLKPQKFALLLKQKEDVFLLYRGWLEMQWQLVADSKRENIRWLSKPDSGLYKRASLVENRLQLQNAVMQLQAQQRVIEDKISSLIVPEGKDVEQLLVDLYRDKPSEISYAPWGFGYTVSYIRGNKRYELTNHLGNVLAVVSDKKKGADENGDGIIESYNADVISAYDYYPFGSLMPGRTFNSENNKYRYGFNGKENDNEVKGEGNQQDYGFRIYDPRIGKFLSVDPLTKSYPELTPYQFASNRPIDGVDQDGLEYSPASKAYMRDNTAVLVMPATEEIEAVKLKQVNAAMDRIVTKPVSSMSQDYSNTIWGSKGGFEYSKKMFEYESNLFPGGPIGVKALKGEKITASDVAIEAAIYFLPVGKVFRGIKGVGREVLELSVRKTDNLAEHLTADDIRGAIKDIRGTPVLKDDGTPFQHLKEVKDALNGLEYEIKRLNTAINKSEVKGDALEAAQTLRSNLQKQKDNIQATIDRAISAYEKTKQ